MMKKILLLVSLVFLFTGCTPTLGLGGGSMGAGKSMKAGQGMSQGQSMRIANPNVSSSQISLFD